MLGLAVGNEKQTKTYTKLSTLFSLRYSACVIPLGAYPMANTQTVSVGISDPFDELDAAVDADSWDWLSENHPRLATGVITALKCNQSPADIKRRMIVRTQRHELALRCEQAARHLANQARQN